MSSRQKSIWNFLSSAFGLIITIIFGLLLPRLFIVSYGSEVNGLLSSLNQLLVYLGLFEAGVGAATIQALYKPVAEDDWHGISRVLAATDRYYRRTGRWYLAALILLSAVYPLAVSSELPYATVAGAVFFSGIGNVVLFYFQGKYRFLLQADGKSYISTNLTTVISVLTSLAKVALIALGADIVWILAAAFLIQCLQAVYILWYIRSSYPALHLDAEPDIQAIAQRNYALVHQISSLVFNNTDVLILTMVCGLRTVSVYSLYKLITSHLENILSTLMTAVSFVLGQNYQTDRSLFIRRIDFFESVYSAVLFSLFSVAYFLLLPFMRLYTAGVTDVNYVDARLALLFVLVSLLNQSRMPMLQVINYAGHYQQTLSRSILESAINLIVSLMLVFPLGIYGVLLGTVAALSYRTCDILFYANRKLLGRSPVRSFAVYCVNGVLFLGIHLLLPRIFAAVPVSSWGTFMLIGVLSTLLCLVVFLAGQFVVFPSCRSVLCSLKRHFK